MKPRDSNKVPEEQGVQKVGYKRPPAHTQFKKGVSGNPGGVKRGTVFISEAYKRMLAMSPDELKTYKPKNVAEQIAIGQVRIAGGDGLEQQSLMAAREIADRTEGKAPQKVEVNTEVNVTQVQLFLNAAADLAQRHGVPFELAKERMLALRPDLAELMS